MRLLKYIDKNNISNCYLYPKNVIEFLDLIDKNKFFRKVIIFFPDPWPKKKHFKRRLINKNFLLKLHKYLHDDCEVYVATDSTPYIVEILTAINELKSLFLWKNSTELHLSVKDYFNIETKFYKKSIISGIIPTIFVLKKI